MSADARVLDDFDYAALRAERAIRDVLPRRGVVFLPITDDDRVRGVVRFTVGDSAVFRLAVS